MLTPHSFRFGGLHDRYDRHPGSISWGLFVPSPHDYPTNDCASNRAARKPTRHSPTLAKMLTDPRNRSWVGVISEIAVKGGPHRLNEVES